MKLCSKCQQHQPYDNFNRNRARYDGYCNYCKKCERQKPVNKEAVKRRNERFRKSEKGIAYFQKYYLLNKDSYNKSRDNWIKNNRERWLELGRINSKTDKSKKRHRFQEAKRRAMLLSATPPWVNMEEIKRIYENCPPGYHVDHIMPLNHPLLCGLHVPWNLQYLPAEENIRKSNKVEELDGLR